MADDPHLLTTDPPHSARVTSSGGGGAWGWAAQRSPATQFLVTGVLGPHSNAHGPNEFLHLPTGRKVTAAVAVALHAAATRGTT